MQNIRSDWRTSLPSCSSWAAERGQVPVGGGASFEVSHHDFSKFSNVPSVSLLVCIPSDTSGSWYHGQVNISLKEGAFEPSSPLCHSAELSNFMTNHNLLDNPALRLYSDGGPDHRLTYLSVKVALICLFLLHDLDYLIATRTAPHQSWWNPVKRVMSTLNLGLQCVGLEWHADDESSNWGTVKKHFGNHYWELTAAVMRPTCSLRRKSDLTKVPKLKEFLSHCTRECHYIFEVKNVVKNNAPLANHFNSQRKSLSKLSPFQTQ